MPSVGVMFELDFAETLPGESVCVLGARPELGTWAVQPGATAQLSTNAISYPRWICLRPVWLECTEAEVRAGSVVVEYKYVVAQSLGSSRVAWEDIVGNRRVSLPMESGAVFLVRDAHLGRATSPQVVRTTMREVRARWASFGPQAAAASPIGPGGCFPIEREFHLMSPRIYTVSEEAEAAGEEEDEEGDVPKAAAFRFPPMGAEIALTTEDSCSDSYVDDDEEEEEEEEEDFDCYDDGVTSDAGPITDIGCDAGAADCDSDAGAAVVSAETHGALQVEAHALREENRRLREEMRLLAAIARGGLQPAATPTKRRAQNFPVAPCSPDGDEILKRRQEAEAWAAYFKDPSSEKTLFSPLSTASTNDQTPPRERDEAMCRRPAISRMRSLDECCEREPHEEP